MKKDKQYNQYLKHKRLKEQLMWDTLKQKPIAEAGHDYAKSYTKPYICPSPGYVF